MTQFIPQGLEIRNMIGAFLFSSALSLTPLGHGAIFSVIVTLNIICQDAQNRQSMFSNHFKPYPGIVDIGKLA